MLSRNHHLNLNPSNLPNLRNTNMRPSHCRSSMSQSSHNLYSRSLSQRLP